VLRPLTAEDAEAFYTRLVCDPIVMAFYHAYAGPLTEVERRARAQRDFFDHFADGWARASAISVGRSRPGRQSPAPAEGRSRRAISSAGPGS